MNEPLTSPKKMDDIWLDPNESPGFIVRETNIAVGNALRHRLSEYQMTLGQYYFMRALWIEEGLNQRQLSQRVGTTEPTTASVLRLLEKNGLVQRIRNKKDRRTINVFPTQKGRELKNELLNMAIGINEIASNGFSDHDLKEVKRLMRAMKTNLDADANSS